MTGPAPRLGPDEPDADDVTGPASRLGPDEPDADDSRRLHVVADPHAGAAKRFVPRGTLWRPGDDGEAEHEVVEVGPDRAGGRHGAALLDRPAPRLHLRAQDGTWVDTGSFVGSRHVLLAFMRHLGCQFCRLTLRRLRELTPEFTAAGTQIVGVVPAAADEVARFRPANRVGFPVLADHAGDSYRAFGVPRGTASTTFGARSTAEIVKAGLLHGVLPGRMSKRRGDLRQLSGAFLVDREGIVRLAWTGEFQGDDIDWPVILARITRLGHA